MTLFETDFRRRLPLRFWAVLLAVPLSFLALLHVLDRAPVIAAQWRHDEAFAVLSDAAAPPDFLRWERVTLPDIDRPSGRRITSAWYRFTVRVIGPRTESWAVYLFEPGANVAVYVNGEYVGDGGSFTPPIPEHSIALYFELPGALLREGDNVVQIRSVAQWPGTWMNTVYIGPAVALQPSYACAVAVRLLALQITMALAMVTGLIMALMFVLYRRETAFGWLALAIFAWVLHALAAVMPQAPIAHRYVWIAATDSMLGWFIVLAMLFVHRFLGMRPAHIERIGLTWCAVGSVLLVYVAAAFDQPVDFLINWLWLPGAHAVSVYIIVILVRAALSRPSFDVRLLLLAAVTGEVIGLRDFLVFANLLPGSNTLYLNHAISLELVAFGTILLRRCVRALHETETLNRDLEVLVAQRTEESQHNLVKLLDMQRQHAVTAERERVMRDVHEGLGGRLVEALSLTSIDARLKPAEPMLRAILDELRLIVDAIEPADGDLLVVLGMLRSRMAKRVEASGLRIEWDVDNVPRLHDLSPHKVLQILRIVQEAISNALKHAQATTLTIHMRLMPNSTAAGPSNVGEPGFVVVIEVVDDGVGMAQTTSQGHGLRNMHYRAQQIGGRLVVESGQPGTSVRLLLPVDLAQSRSAEPG